MFRLRLLATAVGGSLARTGVVAHPRLNHEQLTRVRSDFGVNYDRQEDGSVGPRTVVLDTTPLSALWPSPPLKKWLSR